MKDDFHSSTIIQREHERVTTFSGHSATAKNHLAF
jgi:hypothetical protein